MKIVIKSQETRLFLLFPTALVLNRFGAVLAVGIFQKKWPTLAIQVEDIMALIDSIKEYKHSHARLDIVDIRSADGEIVFISL